MPRTRSTVVSFDRPYNWAVLEGGYPPVDPTAYEMCCGFVATELGVVTTMEHLGLDVAYTTDIDVQEHPAQLLRHKALVSGGHDEYWSVAKRNAVETARRNGVNLMFLGPNPVYWRIRTTASPLGHDRLEVNYRMAKDDPLFGKDDAQVTTLWRTRLPRRPDLRAPSPAWRTSVSVRTTTGSFATPHPGSSPAPDSRTAIISRA